MADSSVMHALDFVQLFDDDIFTFIIGSAQRKFRVHISALKRISTPLTIMMTSGNMKESIEKEAILDDVEPETFARLVKFAYLGLCGIVGSAHTKQSFRPSSTTPPPPPGYRCICCGANVSVTLGDKAVDFPFCSGNRHAKTIDSSIYVKYCVVYNCLKNWTSPTSRQLSQSGNWVCSDHSMSHGPTHNSLQNPFQSSSVALSPACDVFASLQYACESLTHIKLSTIINSHQSTATATAAISPSLIKHAHLYCLADRYIVPELPAICLHMLHREMLAFAITPESVGDLTDLLLYTYTHTRDDGDILDGSCDALRMLVMEYILSQSAELLKYKSFRDVLSAGGEQTSDFMAMTFARTGGVTI